VFNRHWEAGEATVITSTDTPAGYERISISGRRQYVVDVRPSDGDSVFRAEITQDYDVSMSTGGRHNLRRLDDGEVIPVLFDQKRHNVKIDESYPRLYNPPLVDPQRALNSVLSAPPGTAPERHPDRLGE
jgi:hypothetical protein